MDFAKKDMSARDREIIDLYFARDERAITETERSYGRACLRVSMGILGSHADAEECVNDTYLKTWESIPPARPASLCAYICRIVRNLSIDRLRVLNAARRNRDLTVSLSELEECIPVREDAAGELAEVLSDFLRGIDERDRALFLGRYWYAIPVKTLAVEWDMSPTAVSLRLGRTRARLKDYLTERGYTV